MFGKKFRPGETYHFKMVISPSGDPRGKVDELNGGFIPERGDTEDSIREDIIAQYLRENRYAKNILVLSFSWR